MSFKFNFGGDLPPDGDENIDVRKDDESVDPELYKCQRHTIDKTKLPKLNLDFLEIGDVTMKFVNPEHAASSIENESITSLITSSDLKSGQYEGGLKIWECTYDLLTYLEGSDSSLTAGKNVLDLGCGAGMLGLYTMLKDAKSVCFQDYNREVIDAFTIPNACATLKETDFERLDFLSGDWGDVSVHLTDNKHEKFDLILSSETIYNVEYYGKLGDILHEHMAEDGMALFAAKTHYFGVGGGTYDFVKFLKHTGLFIVTTEMKLEDGLCREILKVVKKKKI